MPAGMVAYLEELVSVSDRLDRGRLRRGRLGGLEAAHRRVWASKIQLVGDDLFVTNLNACGAASRAARPTPSW